MGLQITFTLDELTPTTARALVALVADAFPDAVRDRGQVDDGVTGPPSAFLTESGPHYSGPPASVTAPERKPTFAEVHEANRERPSPGFTPPTDGVPPVPPTEPDASPAVVAGPTPDRDADGLPWDARIHASTRVLNADGTWRARRAVHEDTRKLVEAELRQNMAAPSVQVGDVITGHPDGAMTVTVVSAPDVPPPPPTPDVPPPPPADAPVLSGPQLFANLMRKTTAAQTAGKLSSADVAAVATGLGLTSTAALRTRADLIPAAEAQIDALIAAAG